MNPTVWGDFEVFLDRVVGRGGTSVVYEARQISLDRRCVVKVLESPSSDPALREELLSRFRNEAKLIARIRDPRIIQVYQAGENDGRLWFAMERAEGGTLESLIESGALIPEAEVVRIGKEIALGLRSAYEQEGMIHRDIKPSNVFLTRSKEIRIADFGLAKIVSERSTRFTDPGTVMGTPSYLAPEIIQGKEVDHRADLYALGCLLYELLVQLPPFDGENFVDVFYKHVNERPAAPRELRPEISPSLNAVVMKCLSKNREDRFAGYDEFIRALEPPAAEPTPGRRSISKGWIAGAAAVAAGIALLAFLPTPPTPKSEPAPIVKTPEAPPPECPAAEPPADRNPEILRDLVEKDRNFEKAVELGTRLIRKYPQRKDLAALLATAQIALGDDRNLEPPLSEHAAAIRAVTRLAALSDLESLAKRIDGLQTWAASEDRTALLRAVALALSAEGLDRLGATAEAASMREQASRLFPGLKIRTEKPVLDGGAIVKSVEQSSRSGDLEPARKLNMIAQRFSLASVLAEMRGLERELHASELLATGNDADVLQNFSGTRAYAELTERILADFLREARRNWIESAGAWRKRGPDLSKTQFEFAEKTLSFQSPVAAYAECPAPHAERGYSIEWEARLEEKGWAAVVLQPEPAILLSVAADGIELKIGDQSRAKTRGTGPIRLEIVSYKDHVVVYVRGEPMAVLAPGEIVLDSVIRIGVCRGTATIRKVEAPE